MEQSDKALHDLLLAIQPADAVHKPCVHCEADNEGGTMEFTPEQDAEIKRRIEAAVTAATAGLATELAALKQGSEEAAIQARIDEAVAATAAAQADLQRQLDEAVARATGAETALADQTAYLEAEAAQLVAAEEAAKVKEARVAEVAEIITFPDSHIAVKADVWAAMSPEAFKAELETYAVLAETHKLKPKPQTTVRAPAGRTAMTAAEGETPAGDERKLGFIADLRRNGQRIDEFA